MSFRSRSRAFKFLLSVSLLTFLSVFYSHRTPHLLLSNTALSNTIQTNNLPSSDAQVQGESQSQVVCDPFSEHGMTFASTDPPYRLLTSWHTFTSDCPVSPDYLQAIRISTHKKNVYDHDERGEISLDFLKNKTILILGDSVDRQSLEFLPQLLGQRPARRFDYQNYTQLPSQGWDLRNVPHEVRIEELGMSVINGFFYGMDDVDEFSYARDWHRPGKFEDRLSQLYVPMVKSMVERGLASPSFISIQSGMWDFAFFGRRDKKMKRNDNSPLSIARLRWWKSRFKSSIRALKIAFPKAKIWIKITHRVGDNWQTSMDWFKEIPYTLPPEQNFTSFFTDHRMSQLRAIQRQIAMEEGIPYFDFYDVFEGWQRFQDRVHPKLFPSGPLVSQALIHHVWMESQGRENWKVRNCQFIEGCGI